MKERKKMNKSERKRINLRIESNIENKDQYKRITIKNKYNNRNEKC